MKPYLLSTFSYVTSSDFVYLRLNLGRVFYSDLLWFLLRSLSLARAHFSPPSSIKRLRGSLAPRSSCPLASTALFFEVMPGWSNKPLRSQVSRPCFYRQSQVSGGQMACSPPSLHYYFIVWFCIPPAQPVVDTDSSVLLLTHVYSSLPQQEQTKQKGEEEEGAAWPNSPPTLN